ncbi:Rna-processing protein [Globisporangium polare]
MAPTAGTRLRFKQAKSKKHQAPAAKKTPSLKNRIRALDRFLKRGGLDDATRASKQRELQQLQDELEKKGMTEQEKQNAEKYKKFRFVERVKLMRKLKQAKAAMEKATGAAEKQKHSAEFEKWRQELLYVFYFPKMEQYISLFPSNPHDDKKLKRQSELRAAAIARYEKEQPRDAFHQFCYNDSGKSEKHVDANDDDDEDMAAAVSSHHKHPASAAELLLKRPSKEEQKRKSKKPSSKKDKDKKKRSEVVLADQDDNDDREDGVRKNSKKAAAGSDGDEVNAEEEEEDDFFL